MASMKQIIEGMGILETYVDPTKAWCRTGEEGDLVVPGPRWVNPADLDRLVELGFWWSNVNSGWTVFT